MRGSRALLLALAVAAGLLALAVVLRGQYARLLAAHWRNQLQSVPDERAGTLVEGVAQLGEPGIPVLVEALGSERESVAGAAKRALLDEMRRWEMLRAREYSPKLAILARALANRVDQFGPTARADAADLASRILRLWTLDRSVVDPPEVIACCERVLRATSPQRRLLAAKRGPGQFGYDTSGGGLSEGESADLGRARRLPSDVSREPDTPLQGIAALPGGGIPIETLDVPRLLADGSDPSGGPRLADAHRGEPRRLNSNGASITPEQQPGPLSERHAPALIPGRGAAESDGKGPIDGALVRPLGLFEEVPGAAGDWPGERSASAELAAVDTVELMRRLCAPDDRTAARARSELVRRGFTETHLALARRMFDPDPRVRTELARLLAEVPGVNAAPWLLELSRDEDPEVRLSAIVLMATTGDPALVEAVEAIAREDPDPRVKRQAERIARERRAGTY